MKIELGKTLTESSLYVINGKEEIQLDDVWDNIIEVCEGDVITIYTKQVTKKELTFSLFFFLFHILSALLRCVLLNLESDYVEKKLEPYAIQCKYKVLKEDIENGIVIDYFPSKYRGDSDRIYDAKIKINDIEQNIKQIENSLQGIKVLNSFYMDMGWLALLISVLGIYCVTFGIKQLADNRGVISIVLGVILILGVWSTFIIKIIIDKRMIKRMIAKY